MGVITLNLSEEIEQYVRAEAKRLYPNLDKGAIKATLHEIIADYRKRHETE